jgi:hypothetical protein
MRNHAKARNDKPQHRTRVVLDESEIQRRLARPEKPTLAELYARETEAAQRDRFYGEAGRTYAAPAQKPSQPIPARTVWVTRPILQSRGWTDTAIREFLPKPERRQPNPHPGGAGRPMQLWSARTVARAEATVAWRQWLRSSLSRRRISTEDLADLPKGEGFRRRAAAADAAIAAFQRADAARIGPSRTREHGP